jgi:hypothetical protein
MPMLTREREIPRQERASDGKEEKWETNNNRNIHGEGQENQRRNECASALAANYH